MSNVSLIWKITDEIPKKPCFRKWPATLEFCSPRPPPGRDVDQTSTNDWGTPGSYSFKFSILLFEKLNGLTIKNFQSFLLENLRGLPSKTLDPLVGKFKGLTIENFRSFQLENLRALPSKALGVLHLKMTIRSEGQPFETRLFANLIPRRLNLAPSFKFTTSITTSIYCITHIKCSKQVYEPVAKGTINFLVYGLEWLDLGPDGGEVENTGFEWTWLCFSTLAVPF